MLRILAPGLLTCIQDHGRFGHQKEGVVVGGAADLMALKVGNLLVGNKENEAALEVCMHGPKILFEEDHLIAIIGRNLNPTINKEPIGMYRQVWVRKNSILEFGLPVDGRFSYIAVSGGFDITRIMGSFSTYLRASLGGFYGRALNKGDLLKVKAANQKYMERGHFLKAYQMASWSLGPMFRPSSSFQLKIGVLKGPEYALFSEEGKKTFWNSPYIISKQSDRMGYRLQGKAIFLKKKIEMLSETVTFGTVQVPPDGNPVVLMPDRQTTGGYPRIAQVIASDLAVLAQASFNSTLYFRQVTIEEAHKLYFEQQALIQKIGKGIELKTLFG